MKNLSDLTRHTSWNLLGLVVPLIVAVFAIPPLIHGLGIERFGVLTIGWVIMGYFSMFDFGMGLATTRFVAASIAREDDQQIPPLVWSSLLAHIVLGLFGGCVFALMVPWLSGSTFNITAELKPEVSSGFYMLAASVPLVVSSTCLRGVLEGLRRFDLVNKVKIPAGIINYLGPLIVLQFTDHLLYIIGIIVVGRGLVFLVYLLLCLRTLPDLGFRFKFAGSLIKPLIGFGGWAATSSLTMPLIASLDRFIIGAVVSMTAVAYYATPYEVVTKLWIFSASLLSALFPVFSALSVDRGEEMRPMGARAVKCLLVITAPAVAILFVFSNPLLNLWIGTDFAEHSAPVARWLAAGVLVNVLAQVPFTILQGWGRADLPAKLQLLLLPAYALTAYYLAQVAGISGVAIAWTLRAGIELVVLTAAVDRVLPRDASGVRVVWFQPRTVLTTLAFLILFWTLGSGVVSGFAATLVLFATAFVLFVSWEWLSVLDHQDRQALIRIARSFGSTPNKAFK